MDFRMWEGTEALVRLGVLLEMAFALEAGDRRHADRVLVRATRWLGRRGGDDPMVREARDELRRGFPTRRPADWRGTPARRRDTFAGCYA
jgi:hypothetical protein